jgi:hypothetical protein
MNFVNHHCSLIQSFSKSARMDWGEAARAIGLIISDGSIHRLSQEEASSNAHCGEEREADG